jgi:hypothetical protein
MISLYWGCEELILCISGVAMLTRHVDGLDDTIFRPQGHSAARSLAELQPLPLKRREGSLGEGRGSIDVVMARSVCLNHDLQD